MFADIILLPIHCARFDPAAILAITDAYTEQFWVSVERLFPVESRLNLLLPHHQRLHQHCQRHRGRAPGVEDRRDDLRREQCEP
jgi:hypothetical protein